MPSQRQSEVAPGISDPRVLPLVGRDEEVAVCGALLAQRDAAGIVVMGASGVGKTRLATELLHVAEGAGDAPVRVTATEAGRAIPLGPFAYLLPGDAVKAPTLLHLLRLARAAIAVREDGRRTALLVDDAHLLDSASAMLVQQLVAAREATVVATVRTGEPVPDAVVALWKDHGCEYVELQPLSLDETGVLVEALVGGEVDGQTKHRLWDASRGVPLIVRELVLDGLERRLLDARAGLWRWRGPLRAGRRLQELIQARIGQLDDRERELLELVALGEPLGASLLDPSEAVAADNLTRRGVLVADRYRRRLELRLAHPLFGESVRAGMPATRGSALQRRLADALETTGLRRSGDLLRFVVWRLDSSGTAAAELLLRAAGLSEVSLDPVLAERLARAAVEAGAGFPAERAVARALIGQERFAEAEALLSSLTERADTEQERASVALAHARNLVVGLGRGAEAEAALASAMKLVSDAELRRELELVRCWVLSRRGRSPEAAEAALALVAGHADRNFRVRAAGIAVHALVWAGRTDDALALVDRWQPDAEEEDTGHGPLLRAQYRGGRALALLCNGRLEEAEIAADEAYARFVGDRTTEATALMALGCGLAALHRGHLTAAGRWFREASELLREADPTGSLPLALSLMAQARGQAGDADGATEAATDAERARRPGRWLSDVDVLLGRAWAEAAAGALTEAQQKAHMAAELAEERGATLAVKSAHDLLRLGDPHQAAARLARFAGGVQGSLGTACAEHAEAIVSGDARRIEHAAAQFADMGARLWAAEAESAAASVHRETGRDSSARAAAARAASLLARCGGARTPALAGPVEELTAREREIATLAARGASNREIAARLVVSVRTVENQLQRAYRKLGVRNRGELPRVLHVPE
jgi:DNA-binding CsgD family transcriptional regulator